MRTDQKPAIVGDVLEVRHNQKLIGQIRRRSEAVQDIEFLYDQAWMIDRDSFPISIRMPLATRTHSPQIVYPWFLNLLPEGRTLQIIGAILQISDTDVFAMLEEMGDDLPGALEISRPATSNSARNPRYRRLSETELADAIRRLPERPLLVGEEGIHMSLAGAQDKLAVARYNDGGIALALDGMPTTHILKPRSVRFRASVENEAFCLRLAAAVRLPAAEVSIGRAEDIDYLLVKRYDRPIVQGVVRKIHQEDFCQATGFVPHLKYEWNPQIRKNGPDLKACLDALNKTRAAALNKNRFLDYMIFNVLCGNVDAHSKNYSLLLHAAGNVAMAPLYDVMNGDIYEGVTRNIAMKIAGKSRANHIHGRHWDRFAEENGLSATQVKRRVRELSEAVLRAMPSVIAEMNVMKESNVYGEIAEYVGRCCGSMLANLQKDAPDDTESEENAASSIKAPGFS